MENLAQESVIRFAGLLSIDFVNTQRCPCVHRRIDISKGPFISRNLPIWVHRSIDHEMQELLLRFFCIDLRQCNTVESKIPRCVPRILPRVRHAENKVIVQVLPIAVAPSLSRCRWWGHRRIARDPIANLIRICLLTPQQSTPRLSLNLSQLWIVDESLLLRIKLICLRFSFHHDRFEVGKSDFRRRWTEANANDLRLTRCNFKNILSGHLCARLGWIYRVCSLIYNEIIDPIFEEFSIARQSIQSLHICFVFAKQ